MIGTSFPIKRATVLSILSLLLCASFSFAQSRTLTVRDAIEMRIFINPNLFPGTINAATKVEYSPDSRWFAVVTQRGVLRTNEIESTIWIFDMRAVAQFQV